MPLRNVKKLNLLSLLYFIKYNIIMGKTVKRSRKLYKKMNKVKLKTKRKIRKNSVKKGGSWLSCSSKEGGNVKKPKPKPKPKQMLPMIRVKPVKMRVKRNGSGYCKKRQEEWFGVSF